jgi:predicted peroxiredoxin
MAENQQTRHLQTMESPIRKEGEEMKFAHDFIMASHKAAKHPYMALFFFMVAVLAFHKNWKNERVDVNGVN